ncbi:MAG: phytanoyl-CoA dioxygenase family protein [Sneathiella sp.]|uniref:phytanoyl-CoA dioxygenase family protein n=1 Tax=Sneathiella sp. TaxID=1964365 RepID=UPI003001AC93
MSTTYDRTELISSISFTDIERDNGSFSEDKLVEAMDLFEQYGFIRLVNVFSHKRMANLNSHYRHRYRHLLQGTNKDDLRPLFTVDVEGPFNDETFYANPHIHSFVCNILGRKCILGAMSSVASYPGAPDQRLHRDTQAIFGDGPDDYTIDKNVPVYAMTVLIPLVDCTLETGCTKVWPKSHLTPNDSEALRIDSLDPEVFVGSALITNSKLLHRGGANLSDRLRPLLYMTYHRSWFRDFYGYEDRPPVNVTNFEYRKIPDNHKHMFSWTKNTYKYIRYKAMVKRLLPRFVKKQAGKIVRR